MKTQEKIDFIISNSAEYISSNLFCKEDKVFHRGRNSYLWTLLLYLYKKDKDHKIIEIAKKSLKTYENCFSLNSNKELILIPGLNDRRNYSTNAIDCGIFLDCINDLKEIINLPDVLNAGAKEIFLNYAFNKLRNLSPLHNQYLWLLTGFSRCINFFGQENKTLYTELVLEIINFFYSENKSDGSCSYYYLKHEDSKPRDDLNHITTYYHSRCLAFVAYSIENISLVDKRLDDYFLKGAFFLAKMYKDDGVKSLSLETKRYYFHNNFELGSSPYDIYVFEKAYYLSEEKYWLYLASKCIDNLYKNINKNGAMQSKKNGKFQDWQCNIMRTTHNAWLTKLSDNFLSSVEKFNHFNDFDKEKSRIKFFSNKDLKESNTSLLYLINKKSFYQFLKNKSPLSNLYGHRLLGIQPKKHLPISNLIRTYPYEYRSLSFACLRLKYLKKDMIVIKAALLQIKDSLFIKKSIKKSLGILNDHLLSYFLIGYTTLSSSFPLEISECINSDKLIAHKIDLADIKGNNKVNIGFRNIYLNKRNLVVIDFVESNRIFYTVIPDYIKWNIEGKKYFFLKLFKRDFLIIKGPFKISYYSD